MKDENQTFEQLVAVARTRYEASIQDDDGNEVYWDVIWILAERGDRETLERLKPLTWGDTFERYFSATVLGRLGIPKQFASDEVLTILLEMLEAESEDGVIGVLISSLGRHQENNERILPALKRYLDHPDERIRLRLAMGLGRYATSEAAEMLITLTSDESSDVRDWATFNLGKQEELDSPAIRAALVARSDDEDADTQAEAFEGLALRRDSRVVPAVLRLFDENGHSALFDYLPILPSERLVSALDEMAKDPNYPGDKAEVKAALARIEAFLDKH